MYDGYDPDRIGILPEWLLLFINMHKKDHPEAKFKIGDKVIHNTKEYEILAVNVQDEDAVEYALNHTYFLVWEEELETVTKIQT